jgi:hypothetical protein
MRSLFRSFTLVLALFALAPATAAAQSDGGTAAPGPTGGSAATDSGTVGLTAVADQLLGEVVHFAGRASTADAGRTVTLERYWELGGEWAPIATATVGDDGTYDAYWRTDHIGRMRVRAIVDAGSDAAAAEASPELGLTVYKPATATWYGPGFYGRHTACGQVMSHRLLGVAHKSLPCGTQVALYFGGRTITVAVVDRGPFRRNTDWDLTSATAQALGMTGTSTIGAVRVRDASAARKRR